MKQIVLLIGIPGSGKTTLAQQLIARGYVCFNADEIRQELFGDEADQSEPEKVFGIFFARLEEALAQNKDIVIDNTNINARHRGPILQRAIRAGYSDIQLWILDVPLPLCLKRNHERGRAVPDEIVQNYYNTLQGKGRPSKHEGKLVIVRQGDGQAQFKFFPVK